MCGRIDVKTGKFYAMRNAVLAAVFLLGSGTLASICMNDSESPGKDPAIAGPGSYGMSPQVVEVPVSAYLPKWFLQRKAVSISREGNASVLKSALAVFDPSLRSFLAEVPIVLDGSVNTARAYQTRGYIAVSPDWDNRVLRSKYRTIYEQRGMKPDEPVFLQRFKTDLLIHEFLHMLQFRQGIDSRSFYEAVSRWYRDPRYGIPSPTGTVADATKGGRPDTLATNRMKYILWHSLYNYRRLSDLPHDESWKDMHYGDRYRWAEKGVEEFAYIGQEILSGGSASENYMKTGQWSDNDWKDKKMRLSEVSPEIIAFYQGLFNPVLTQ